MDAAPDDEPDPIKLKSVKNNRVFTVPQNDRVRVGAVSALLNGELYVPNRL